MVRKRRSFFLSLALLVLVVSTAKGQEKANGLSNALLPMPPTSGRIVETTVDKNLGITHAWLSNGVRIHHLFAKNSKHLVTVSVSFAGGLLEETADHIGMTQVATLVMSRPATSQLNREQIRDILKGKRVSVRARSEIDSFVAYIDGAPKDLELGFQLFYALVTDGKITQAALDGWKSEELRKASRREYGVPFHAMQATFDWASGHDPRRIFLSRKNIESQNLSAAQKWYERHCREAPIEVAVVGEITADKVMPLVARYIGSLKKRKRSAGYLEPLRKRHRSHGPWKRRIEVDSTSTRAIVTVGFVGGDGSDYAGARALKLAGGILQNRFAKKIRDELSLASIVHVTSDASWVFRDSGRFTAAVVCEPANVERVAEEAEKILRAFTETGPTPDELEAGKKDRITSLTIAMENPKGYWLKILRHLELRGQNPQEEKDAKKAYEGITAKQVRDALKKHNTPENHFQVMTVPVKSPHSRRRSKDIDIKSIRNR